MNLFVLQYWQVKIIFYLYNVCIITGIAKQIYLYEKEEKVVYEKAERDNCY